MSTHSNAASNNDKLFPAFMKKFSTLQPKSFDLATEKFAGWLNSEKAYYVAARPKIVELIETAFATLRREASQALTSGTIDLSQCPPDQRVFYEGYCNLLRTVAQFFHSFTERELQQRLSRLLAAAGIDSKTIPIPVSRKKSSSSVSTPSRRSTRRDTTPSIRSVSALGSEVTPSKTAANRDSSTPSLASPSAPLPKLEIVPKPETPFVAPSPSTSRTAPLQPTIYPIPPIPVPIVEPVEAVSTPVIPSSASIPTEQGPAPTNSSSSITTPAPAQEHLPHRPSANAVSHTGAGDPPLSPRRWKSEQLSKTAESGSSASATATIVDTAKTSRSAFVPPSVDSSPTVKEIFVWWLSRRDRSQLSSTAAPKDSQPVSTAARVPSGSVAQVDKAILSEVQSKQSSPPPSDPFVPANPSSNSIPSPSAPPIASIQLPINPNFSSPAVAPTPVSEPPQHKPVAVFDELEFLQLDLQWYQQQKQKQAAHSSSIARPPSPSASDIPSETLTATSAPEASAPTMPSRPSLKPTTVVPPASTSQVSPKSTTSPSLLRTPRTPGISTAPPRKSKSLKDKDAAAGTGAKTKPSPPRIRLQVPPPSRPVASWDNKSVDAVLDLIIGKPSGEPTADSSNPTQVLASTPGSSVPIAALKAPGSNPTPDAGSGSVFVTPPPAIASPVEQRVPHASTSKSPEPSISPHRDLRAEQKARRDASSWNAMPKKHAGLKIFGRQPSGGASAAVRIKTEARDDVSVDVKGKGKGKASSVIDVDVDEQNPLPGDVPMEVDELLPAPQIRQTGSARASPVEAVRATSTTRRTASPASVVSPVANMAHQIPQAKPGSQLENGAGSHGAVTLDEHTRQQNASGSDMQLESRSPTRTPVREVDARSEASDSSKEVRDALAVDEHTAEDIAVSVKPGDRGSGVPAGQDVGQPSAPPRPLLPPFQLEHSSNGKPISPVRTSPQPNPRKRTASPSITQAQDQKVARRRSEAPSTSTTEAMSGIEQHTVDFPGPSRSATPRLQTAAANGLSKRSNLFSSLSPRFENEFFAMCRNSGEDMPSWTVKDEESDEEGELYDELGPVFGPDLCVIDADVGHTGPFTTTLHCNIRPPEFSLMCRFLNARCTTEDITKTMCISLVCYNTSEFASKKGSKEHPEPWKKALLACRPAPWPNRGLLSALINDRTSLSLSAPQMVIDNIIPISSFLKSGQNKIEIRQQPNLSDYVFLLVAHHPIRGQLKEVAKLRKKELDWAWTVYNVCKPPESPAKLWDRFRADLRKS